MLERDDDALWTSVPLFSNRLLLEIKAITKSTNGHIVNRKYTDFCIRIRVVMRSNYIVIQSYFT